MFLELTMQAYSWLLCRAKTSAMPLQKKQVTETRQGEVAVKRDKKGTSLTGLDANSTLAEKNKVGWILLSLHINPVLPTRSARISLKQHLLSFNAWRKPKYQFFSQQ